MHSPRERTVFVLGAGFSVAQGFPLVRGLRAKVIEFLKTERNSAYSSWLDPSAGFPNGKFHDGLERIDPNGSLEFEELLIALSKRLKDRCDGDTCFQVDHAMRVGCARLLWRIQDSIRQVSECYSNFATHLRSDGSDAILSFNWDLLVERMLTDAGLRWSYNATASGIPVLKPHGSMNWSGHLREGLKAESRRWIPLGSDSTICYDSSEPLSNPNEQEINSTLRFMIFPGDPDLPNQDKDVSWLWRHTEQAITERDSLVFIGYSLPDYDSFASNFFQRLAMNKKVAVFTPSEDHLKRYKELFGTSVDLRREKFEGCRFAEKRAS